MPEPPAGDGAQLLSGRCLSCVRVGACVVCQQVIRQHSPEAPMASMSGPCIRSHLSASCGRVATTRGREVLNASRDPYREAGAVESA
eukprot:12362608-Alexandrium_andersonii.AAC.1